MATKRRQIYGERAMKFFMFNVLMKSNEGSTGRHVLVVNISSKQQFLFQFVKDANFFVRTETLQDKLMLRKLFATKPS